MSCRQRRYRSSGRFGWSFVPLAATALAGALVLGGVLYLALLGGLYLVFVTPLVVALGIAWALVVAVDRGHCRNPVLAGALAVAAGILMFGGYFQAGVVGWVGASGFTRVDLLPAYVQFRMQHDEMSDMHSADKGRLAGGNPAGAGPGQAIDALGSATPVINWLLLAAEFLMVEALLVGVATKWASRPYDERRRRWLLELSSAFPAGTGEALAAAIEEGRLGDFLASAPSRVARRPPCSRVILHADPTPGGDTAPVYLTVNEETWKEGRLRRRVLLDRIALTGDETNALAELLPIPSAVSPRSELGWSPSAEADVGVWPVAEHESGKVLSQSSSLVNRALDWSPVVASVALLGLLLLALHTLKAAGPLAQFQPGKAAIACTAVAGVLLLVLLARHLAGPGLVPALYRRRAEDAFRWRAGRFVDPEKPGAVLVEVVPRSNWGRLMLNPATDVGFLRVDPRTRTARFEGDFERYSIPVEAVISCELETPPRLTGMPDESGDPIRLVVLRAHRGGTVWEVPFLVRHDGTPNSGRKTRRQLAEDLLRRLRGDGMAEREVEETEARGTNSRRSAAAAFKPAAWIGTKYFIGILGISLGPVMTLEGFHDIRIARLASARPRIVRVEDVGDVWPAGNPNVTLNDFEPLLDGLVWRSEDPSGPWSTVYIPLIPSRDRGRRAPGEAVRVIVQSHHVRGEDDLRRLFAAGTVTGVLDDRGGFFGPLREGLLRFNPGIDPSRCWMLKEGQQPAPLRNGLGAAIGGTVLFALAFCIGLRSLMNRTHPSSRPADRGLAALGRILRRCQESRSPIAIGALVVAGSVLLGVFAAHVADGYFTDPGVTFLGDLALSAATELGAAPVLLGLSLRVLRRPETASSTVS